MHQQTMNAVHSNHNTMNTDHDWIMVLMQHRMGRQSSARELMRSQSDHPISPSTMRSTRRDSHQVSRQRFMSDNHVVAPESPHESRRKMKVRTSLDRKFTFSTCDSQTSAPSDIPFQISCDLSSSLDKQDQREGMDDISEVTVEEEIFSDGNVCFEDDDDMPDHSASSGTLLEGLPPNPLVGVDHGWGGMMTFRLDDQEVWPSDEGSPAKTKNWQALEGLQISVIDDRQDSERETSVSTACLSGEANAEDRQDHRLFEI